MLNQCVLREIFPCGFSGCICAFVRLKYIIGTIVLFNLFYIIGLAGGTLKGDPAGGTAAGARRGAQLGQDVSYL